MRRKVGAACLVSSRHNTIGLIAKGYSLMAMEISDWRKKIDDLDGQLVDLLSRRAQAAHEIGKLKLTAGMPIYEPDRERAVFDHVRSINPGPLPDRDLQRIFERIMDIMRGIQQQEIAPQAAADGGGDTELDNDVND